MRNLHETQVDRFRKRTADIITHYGSAGDETCGVFEMASPEGGGRLTIIASSGGGWDHISVSKLDRTPSWKEMEFVKRLFFLPTEVAMQLHVCRADHINVHENCLHLWRPNDGRQIPLPPITMV